MKVLVLLGSSREGGMGQRVGTWVSNELKKNSELEIDLVRVGDLNLPYFDEAAAIGYLGGNFKHPEGKAWGERVAAADAFVMITPEYNHGIPAVLKNAIDYAWEGWHYKPLSIVSYSMSPYAGTRAAENLRLVSLGVKLLPLYEAVHIGTVHETVNEDGTLAEGARVSMDGLISELVTIGNKLKD